MSSSHWLAVEDGGVVAVDRIVSVTRERSWEPTSRSVIRTVDGCEHFHADPPLAVLARLGVDVTAAASPQEKP